MSSKVPKWIILFHFQSQSQPQSQTSNENENVPREEGVSKEAELWIMEGPKTGGRKRNRKFGAHKERYEGRVVRRHAHWHKRAKEAHQAKRVQTDGGAFHNESQMLADTIRESEEDIGGDESQFGIKIVAVTPKTNFELPDDNRAPQVENVSEADEHELRMWSRFKTKSELLCAAEGSEVEQATEINEPEVHEHEIKMWSSFKSKSELLGAADGPEVEQATEIDEPEFKMWANVIKSTCKTKSELSDDANAPKDKQVTRVTSCTTSELCDEVCGEAYNYLSSSCCSQVQ